MRRSGLRAATEREPRVLSIQSHVVYGHVGNKSAVWPLQLLGVEVDPLNTVQFSNHTGYGKWGGSRMDAEHILDIFGALETNGLLRHTHLLTGYVPGAEALQAVSTIVDRMRSANEQLIYVLDPVMGDDGKLYVSHEVPPVYKSLLPRATVATPNAFEAELLTGVAITSHESLKACLRAFHDQYSIPHIIVSSCELGDPTKLVCAGSSIDGEAFAIEFPRFAEHYEGVGDLFSALVCARLTATARLRDVAELAIASLQGVIATTRAHALEVATVPLEPSDAETAAQRVDRLRSVELRLIQSVDAIRSPSVLYRAQTL